MAGYGKSTAKRAGRAVFAALAVIPIVALSSGGVANAKASESTGSAGAVVQRAVSFTVQNVNRSKTACHADGATYTVRGHLTGSSQSLADWQSVTLLLHGLSYGEFFGDFTAVDGYNFARWQAESGHATVTIDRLGYGASDKPAGKDICFGSRADIAHQIVEQLRTGKYTSDNAESPSFRKVVLAGHSVGGLIAQTEAYSFGDIDGLMVLSYSDTEVSLAATAALVIATQECAAGGQRQAGDSGPEGYVYFGADTPAKFIEAHFFTPNADPTVVDATAKLRSRDPCGDVRSYKAAVKSNLANVSKINVPTLVLTGAKDAIYPVSADKQAKLLTGSSDVTAITVPATGHALTLHRSAGVFSTQVANWLMQKGFGGWAMPAGAPQTGGGSTSTAQSPAVAIWGAGLLIMGLAGGLLLYRRRMPDAG